MQDIRGDGPPERGWACVRSTRLVVDESGTSTVVMTINVGVPLQNARTPAQFRSLSGMGRAVRTSWRTSRSLHLQTDK
jgi:hypothetical protein